MKKKRLGIRSQGIAVVLALLLAVNALLGLVLVNQSTAAMKTLIHNQMLDTSNTAAAMLDGDALETLTASDAGSEAYEAAMDALKVFQENINLRYIYCIRRVGPKSYIFTVDPTEEDPAAFGEPVPWTAALEAAAQGTPSVDDTPYSDAWGRFYSAYSPVFNSEGGVAGIVAVDFGAEWFDRQLARQTTTIAVGCALSLAVGVAVVLLITGRLRARLRTLDQDMRGLAADVDSLSRQVQIPLSHGYPARQSAAGRELSIDEIGELSQRVRRTQRELRSYLDYIQGQTYSDALTGVGNHIAYQDAVKKLSGRISTNMADFFIVVFDVNGLKTINDNLGHEIGDQLLRDAAGILKASFGAENIYRIGGDEFIAVLERATQASVDGMFADMDARLEAFNASDRRYDIPLSISRGATAYRRGADKQFKDIFRRADEGMYRDKGDFYRSRGGEGARRGREAAGPSASGETPMH